MSAIINNCLTALNNISRGFCNYSAGIFIQSSLLIVLLLLIDFLMRKRVRATFRYWMWMLVLIKIILPPTLSLPTGIGYWCGDFLPSDSSVIRQIPTVAHHESIEIPAVQHFPRVSQTPLKYEVEEYADITESQDSAKSAEIPQFSTPQVGIETTEPLLYESALPNPVVWQAVVFLIWLVGVLVISVLLVQRMLFVKGLITQSVPSNEKLVGIINRCREQIGIRRNIELRISNNISSPSVCGLLNPVILIHPALIKQLSPDKLKAVLVHELAHIKRGDLFVNLVQTVLQIIYFYNPLLWLANCVIRRIREQAVDEMVLVTLGSEAKNYSNTLIDIAEMAFLKTSLSLRLIGVVESKKALHRRIKRILTRPMPKKAKLGILGLVVVIVVGAILLPMAKGNWSRSQKDQIDELVKKLSSEDDSVWKPAAEQLKEIGPKVARQVAELFRTATGDLHAIRVLESMATDEHVQDVMVQGLSADPHLTNSNVRHCSLIILSKSGNRDHVKRIIPLLRKDVENGEDYSMAAIALAELGGDDAYNALVETVTKNIPDQLRWMIADDLVRMGRADALPYLKNALKLVNPSHPSAGARIAEAIHRLEDRNEIVKKPYPNYEHTFTLYEFNSKYSQRGILYAYDLQRANDAGMYVDKPQAGANAEETMLGSLRALAAGSKGDLIFERVGEKTRLQAYHGTLLAPLEGKFEPPHYFWTDTIVKMKQSEVKQLVLDYNNRHAKEIAGSIPGFRLYPFDEGDMFTAVLPSGQIAILAAEKIVSYTSGVRLSVLYLDPLLALVGTERKEVGRNSTANADKSQFIAILPNGITVELIGICEHPSQGKQWWRPDGSRLDERPFEKLYQRVLTKREYYELALKIENPSNRKLSVISKDGKVFNLYSGKIWAGVVLSEGKKMLNQTIGIAHGPWKTIVEAYPKLNQIVGDFAFGEAFESNVEGIGTAVGVTVTHTIGKEKVDYRVIAVDSKGNIHTSSGRSGLGGGSWIQTTVHFKDLRIDDIKEFQFQTRPYDWVTFNNVSLKPNFKTDMQIDAEKPKSQIPKPAGNYANTNHKYFWRVNIKQTRDTEILKTLSEAIEFFEEPVGFYVRDYGDGVIHCIDFDNNKIIRVPDELDIQDRNAILKWAKQNDVDAMFRRASSLISLDMASVVTSSSEWKKLSGSTLEKLSEKTNGSTDVLYSSGNDVMYHAFKTSQGRIGVLKLTSVENKGLDHRLLLISYKLLKADVQVDLVGKSPEIKVPREMVGTWYFDNPGGDDEQMAVFPDGRVVVLYSNGNKDETRIVNGFIELAEYDNARYKMTVETNGTLVQSFDSGGSLLVGKRWKRIDSQPRTNLLRVLTGPNSGKPVAQVKPEIDWVVEDSGLTRLLSKKEMPDIDNWISIWGVAVKNKGRYLVPDEGLTLKDLIKAAGYNKDKLAESYVELSRRSRQGNITARSNYSRNLKTLLSGEESDVLLKPHDTVSGSYVEPSANGVEFWSGYHFGNVVELTVNDDGAKVNMFADLDTGKLITPPDTLDNNDENAVLRWIKENGIDVMGETAASVHGLAGFNMYAARVDNYFWDAAPREITDRLMVRIDDPVLLSVENRLPVTYLIKTSKYKMGILQILGFTENPRGIKIRYKLLDKKDSPESDVPVGPELLSGDWQYIGRSIPPDYNDTMILAEHINLGSIGHDAEGKTFITFIRDGQQAQDRQYRFVLFTKDGDILEPDGHLVLGEGKRLEEKFTFDEPFITRYLKGFKFQARPSPPSGIDNVTSQLQKGASEVNKDEALLPSNLAPPGRYAVELDGVDDYLLVPDSPSLRLEPPFTIEMWIKTKLPPDASEYRGGWAVISKGFTVGTPRAYSTGFGINIQRFPNEPSNLHIDFCKANNSGTYSAMYAGYPLKNGVSDWIHIHHVFDGQYYKSAPGHPLVMGKFLIPTNEPFKGLLGEVRLWNGARTRQELRQYENIALSGNEPGLAACWTFEQIEGQYALDISDNNNHARLGKLTVPDSADPRWIDLQPPSPQPDLQADDKNSRGEGVLMLEGFYSFGEGERYTRRLSQIFGKAQTYIEQMSAGYENKDWDNVSDASIQVCDIFFNLKHAIEVDDDTAWEAFTKMWNGEKTNADDVRLVDLARLKHTFKILAFVNGQYHEETHRNLCSSIVNIADMADEIQKALRAKRTTMISSYVEELKANWAVLVEIEGIKKIFPPGFQTKDKTDLQTEDKKSDTEISGFVLDENGAPISGATVTLLNKELALLPKPERIGSTMRMIIFDNFYDITDTNGRFEFLDFNPGKTDIIVKSRGYRTEILSEITTDTKNLKVTLRKPSAYWLAGKVVDGDGNPISGVEITLAEKSYTTVRTDEKGVFRFAKKLEPTEVHRARMLFARKEGFGIWGKTLDTTGGETYVKITLLPEEKISGRVVDQAGEPIANATVVFWSCYGRDTEFSFTGYWRIVAPRTETDTDGRFTLTGIPTESDVFLRALSWGYASSEYGIKTGKFGSYAVKNEEQGTIEVIGSNRQPQETIEFKLQKAVTLLGTLTYEGSGRPAPGKRVATQSHKKSHWAETRTDPDGHFKLEGVSPNPCNLLVVREDSEKVSLPQWTAAAVVFNNLQEGETRSGIRLVLTKGGIIRGKVVDAQGNPLHGIDIAFYSAARPRSGAACQSVLTAKDGTWAYRFPPGDVYVYIRTTIPEGKWTKKIYNLHIDDGQLIDNIDFELSHVVPENSPYRREITMTIGL